MNLSIIAIPILIIAIIYMFYYKKKANANKTSETKQKTQNLNSRFDARFDATKGPKRKFDLKLLESRVRRRMAVST